MVRCGIPRQHAQELSRGHRVLHTGEGAHPLNRPFPSNRNADQTRVVLWFGAALRVPRCDICCRIIEPVSRKAREGIPKILANSYRLRREQRGDRLKAGTAGLQHTALYGSRCRFWDLYSSWPNSDVPPRCHGELDVTSGGRGPKKIAESRKT